ncbi:hypothetical protein ABK040_001192 [Willaertia magna]
MSVFKFLFLLFIILQISFHNNVLAKSILLNNNVLDEYVWKNDGAYKYNLLNTYDLPTGTLYVINMTSQYWLNAKEIGIRTEWYHYMTITIPKNLNKNIKDSFLWVEGGNNNGNPPKQDALCALVSGFSNTICTTVFEVPNQPIVFSNDPTQQKRTEDAVLAYTWKIFINNTSDPYWIGQLPMAKGVVKAMDTVQDFVKKTINFQLDKFVIAGGSKRGWATWLGASADVKRVKAIIPIVIAVLNTEKALSRDYQSICRWPEAMDEYVKTGVVNYLNTKQFGLLRDIIDPLVYTPRLQNIHKFLIYALGDEFFWPDLSTLFYNDIAGDNQYKHLLYVPNAGHSLAGSDAQTVAATYYLSAIHNVELPNYTFNQTFTDNGSHLYVTVLNGKKPSSVRLWKATNSNARDFRLYITGKIWESTQLSPSSENDPFTFQAFVNNPPAGFTSFMIELTFDNYLGNGLPMRFSTSAYITPNILPCGSNKK